MIKPAIPSLPSGIVSLALCGDYPEVLNALKKYNIDTILLEKDPMLPEAVSRHADMLCCHLAPELIFTCDEKAAAALKAYGIWAILPHKRPSGGYPDDVSLNCAALGREMLLCNEKYCADEIKKEAHRLGMDIIHVRQGYSRCSTAIVDGHSVISADTGICAALEKIGYDVLRISAGSIRLDGYDYGFIGGCCGKISKNEMIFYGDLRTHPDGQAIADFLRSRDIEPVSIGDGELCDFGGFIPVLESV